MPRFLFRLDVVRRQRSVVAIEAEDGAHVGDLEVADERPDHVLVDVFVRAAVARLHRPAGKPVASGSACVSRPPSPRICAQATAPDSIRSGSTVRPQAEVVITVGATRPPTPSFYTRRTRDLATREVCSI